MRTLKKVDAHQLKYYAQASLVSASLLFLLIALSCLWNMPNSFWRMAAAMSIIPSLLLFASSHVIAAQFTDIVLAHNDLARFNGQMQLRNKLDNALQRRRMKALMKKLQPEQISFD